ncbi:MAG: serine acetyltransferase [Oscillospiraceae bacterium]|nr:serine acetyltransferase [Oscillospiraceae bacterium]
MKTNRFHKLLHYGMKCHKKGRKLSRRIIGLLIKLVYKADIPLGTDIDETVWFCHSGFGTVINPRAVIGADTVIQHRVTIGELSDNGGAPIIEKNVYIGAGAIILGDITVGENAKIGAGAVVVKDVPKNSTAVGNPARIILHDEKE